MLKLEARVSFTLATAVAPSFVSMYLQCPPSCDLDFAACYDLQGHVRVGPETVLDPAFLVTRPMEDFVTWVDTSKIRRKVMQYNDKLDDYDLLN